MKIKSILIQALIFLKDFLNKVSEFLKELFVKFKKSILRFKKQIIRRKNRIKSNISKKRNKIKKRIKKINFKPILNFVIFVFSYGFLINYVLTVLMDFKISFFTIPAWGIVCYFIREEFPGIIKKIIRR